MPASSGAVMQAIKASVMGMTTSDVQLRPAALIARNQHICAAQGCTGQA
jgi:hypothetical protein